MRTVALAFSRNYLPSTEFVEPWLCLLPATVLGAAVPGTALVPPALGAVPGAAVPAL